MLFDNCDIYLTDAPYIFHPNNNGPNSFRTVPNGAALGCAIALFGEANKDLEFRKCRFHVEIVSGSHPLTGFFVQNGNVGSVIKLTQGCTFNGGFPAINYGSCTLQHDGTTSPSGHWTGSGPVMLI
jgi:hypothetical protein